MKNKRHLLLVVMLVSALVVTGQGCRSNLNRNIGVAPVESNVALLTAIEYIDLAKSNVTVLVTLTNQGPKIVAFDFMHPTTDLKVDLFDSNGTRPPLTASGKLLMGTPEERKYVLHRAGSHVTGQLIPRDIFDTIGLPKRDGSFYSWHYNLMETFNIRPGTYSFTVEYQSGDLHVKSRTNTFLAK